MEPGYVMGRNFMGGLAVATIGWLPTGDDPSGTVTSGRWSSQPLAPPGFTIFAGHPHFPAWRCAKCRRVEFSYAEVNMVP